MIPSNELAASVQPPNEVNNLEEGRRVEIIDDDNENQPPVPFSDIVEADRRSEAEHLKAREYHNNNDAIATATLSPHNRPRNSDMSLDFDGTSSPPNQSSFISDLARRQSSGDTNMARADSTQTSAAIPASRSTQYQPRHSSPLVATLVQNVEEATLIRQPTIYNATIVPDTPPPSVPRPSRFSVNPMLRRLFRYDDNEHDNPNNNASSGSIITSRGSMSERKRKVIIASIIIPLILLLVIVGVVMGVGGNGKSSNDDDEENSAVSSSPTISPPTITPPTPLIPSEYCSPTTITVEYDDNPHETSWELYSIQDTNKMLIKSHEAGQHNKEMYKESICLEEGGYEFTIKDKAGDGICCGLEGDGHYNITSSEGELLAKGGEFGSSETTLFLVSATCYSVGIAVLYDDNPHESSWYLSRKEGDENELINSYTGKHGDKEHPVSVCLEEGEYNFTMTDAAGDGICCGLEGDGSYEVTSEGKLIVQGGDFGKSETTLFSIPYGVTEEPSCITVTVKYDDRPWQTSWDIQTAGDDGGEEVESYKGEIEMGDTDSIQTICLDAGQYKFSIYDALARDGICCSYGEGYYRVTSEYGDLIAEGGEFGELESTWFVLPYVPN